MSHTRTSSEITVKTPHAVSLKVLRLSKPSLSQQIPLPSSSSVFHISPTAALASHSVNPDPDFILSPLLTLPSSFGILHVGETFTCTLCANNEQESDGDRDRNITDVSITADMQTPSSIEAAQLELEASPNVGDAAVAASLQPGQTLQRIMRYYLREEGSHVLAVTVTYKDRSSTSTAMTQRTFRKLYQFAAQSLMGIRTKVRALPAADVPSRSNAGNKAFALEAQLENYGDNAIVLDQIEIMCRPGMESRSLDESMTRSKPTILPGDVIQVAYILRETMYNDEDGAAKMRKEATGLCQLAVTWRTSLGEEGTLTTAWLGGKRRG